RFDCYYKLSFPPHPLTPSYSHPKNALAFSWNPLLCGDVEQYHSFKLVIKYDNTINISDLIVAINYLFPLTP
ncbi:hypothetical protein JXR93_04330, partial [bacterium]|nr:hypothetical protein [bacterium]